MTLFTNSLLTSNHYNQRVQAIETMQANMTPAEFKGFLKGNIIKYCCRCGRKDEEASEVKKILVYATWLYEASQGKTINPRQISL